MDECKPLPQPPAGPKQLLRRAGHLAPPSLIPALGAALAGVSTEIGARLTVSVIAHTCARGRNGMIDDSPVLVLNNPPTKQRSSDGGTWRALRNNGARSVLGFMTVMK